MKATWIPLCLVMAVATAVQAQQGGAPPVAPEMAKFDVLLGNWESSGIVRMSPGGPELPWTSVSTTKKVLGGHFVMDHVKIEAEGMPVPMIFHSVAGWDPARQKYVTFEMGNAGASQETIVQFAGNRMMSTSSGEEDGVAVADHWVTEIDGDEMHFEGHRSVEGGPFFVHLEGTATRGGPGFSVGPKTADYVIAPPGDHLEPLAMLAGDWSFEGRWKPAPGAEAMPIGGRETTQAILGGHVIRSHMNGQGGGMDYEAFRFMAWCPGENCIVSLGVNNMGEYHASKCFVDGDRFLSVAAGIANGTPTAMRGVMKLSKDTLIWKGHAAQGADEPYLSFEGTWTRVY